MKYFYITNVVVANITVSSYRQIALAHLKKNEKMVLGFIMSVVNKTSAVQPIKHHLINGEAPKQNPLYETPIWEL